MGTIIGGVVISRLERRAVTATLIVRNQSPDCHPKYNITVIVDREALSFTTRVTGMARRGNARRAARGSSNHVPPRVLPVRAANELQLSQDRSEFHRTVEDNLVQSIHEMHYSACWILRDTRERVLDDNAE